MDLKECRERIDAIDDQLAALFKERMEVAAKVAEYKKTNGLPITDPAREKQILDAREKQILESHETPDAVDAAVLVPYVRRFFKHIMKLSREYQNTFTDV